MRRKKTGFTLIETLIVIFIIGFTIVAGINFLMTADDTAQLKSAQGEFSAIVKLAQSYALQGRAQGGTIPAYYGIKFSSTTQYSLLSCSDNLCATNPVTVESRSLPQAISLSSPAPASSALTFNVPHGNIFYSEAGDLVYTFSVSGGSETRTTTIKKGGSLVEN